jgi:hypothetical protein
MNNHWILNIITIAIEKRAVLFCFILFVLNAITKAPNVSGMLMAQLMFVG